LTERNRYIAYL